MDSKRNRHPRRFRLLLLLGGAVLACGVVGIAGAWVLMQQDIAETREQYGTLVDLCNPVRGGEASLANLPTGAGSQQPLRAVVFVEGQRYAGTPHNNLRAEWRADNADQADLVICLQNTQDVVERCSYGDEDDTDPTAFVERIRQGQNIILFNADTSERIVSLSVQADEPDECPDQIFASDGTERQRLGPPVSYAVFEDAVRPYLTGTVER